MNWTLHESVSSNAHRQLPKLAENFFRMGRKAVRDKVAGRELHKFRVQTKKFRYTLEMFRPIYGTSLEASLESLQEIQKLLGKISDDNTIRDLFEDYPKLAKQLEHRAEKHMREFWSHWTEQFDAPGQLRLWKSRLQCVDNHPLIEKVESLSAD